MNATPAQPRPASRNPFNPAFGVAPPLLVGRDDQLRHFAKALADGPGSPGRATLVTGTRGTGKTVLLGAIEQAAKEAGWIAVSATARRGVARELAADTLPALLAKHGPKAVAGGSASPEPPDNDPAAPALGGRLASLAQIAAAQGGGVVVTLDEVNKAAREDSREIAQSVQHAFREGLEVAFVVASLPSAARFVTNDPAITFLRRAERFTLGPLTVDDAAAAIAAPIAQTGRSITAEALALAAAATRGYPFFVQLVGHQVWAADRSAAVIDADQARAGAARAVRRARRLLHEPAMADVSRQDRAFLTAMAADEGSSQVSDIAARLGVTSTHVSRYRARLIAAKMIEPDGRGWLRFTIPFLGEYLRTPQAK
ncbi:MAG: ATP-binding protein [Bifidobacteriaceae bacterium]|jgi:hypothetical protein|nr:ATP-binding protein [Bifidobacteriaceae bacterium]